MRLGIEKHNRAALERLHREVTGPFDLVTAAAVLQMPPERVRRLLSYLASCGWLSRVRRGLYTTVPLGATEPSEWRDDPWRIAAVVFKPCYIGGWSACEHWELTEQVFRGVVVMTSRPIRSTEMNVQGTSYRLKHMPEKLQFGTRMEWRDRMKTKVSDPSRTVVDILDDPRLGGGIRHAAEVVRAYLASPHRDEALVADYAGRLKNRTIFKRLGYIIEALDLDAEALMERCHARVSAGLTLLDPAVKLKGRVRKRWGLRINVELKPEEPS